MPSIPTVLQKAYQYTRDHKRLWFFGFFLTAGWVFSFLRLVSFNSHATTPPQLRPVHPNFHDFNSMLASQGTNLAYWLGAVILLGIVLLIANAFAKIIVMRTAIKLERQEDQRLEKTIREVGKYLWPIIAVNLIAGIVGVIIIFWLAIPAGYLLNQGLVYRGVLLLFFAVAIYIPFFLIITLINIFSCLFILSYNFSVKKAIASAFDLLSRFWVNSVGLFIVLFIIYALVLIISASIVGLIALFAYMLSILLKSISVPLYWIINSLIIIVFSFILIAVNSILNVFTTDSWVIFFLEIVKGNKLPEEAKPIVQPHVA